MFPGVTRCAGSFVCHRSMDVARNSGFYDVFYTLYNVCTVLEACLALFSDSESIYQVTVFLMLFCECFLFLRNENLGQGHKA